MREVLGRQLLEPAMCHRSHDGVSARQLVPRHQPHAVLVHRLVRIGLGIVHRDLDAVAAQLVDDVLDLAVAQVSAVFLERQPQHVDARALDVAARRDHLLDGLLGDVLAHAIVDAPPGQDHLRVVAQHLGLVRQIVRIDADAVPADQPGLELEEVPLRPGRLQHLGRVDADAVEDDRQLVHQRDVQVALRVLDDLAGLGCLDAGTAVHARLDNQAVQLGHPLQRLGRVAGDDLDDVVQRVLAVARVDAFGAVADEEVALPRLATGALQLGDADLLGRPRIDSRLVDDDGAGLEVRADRAAGADQRTEIGDVRLVHRRRHSNDDDIGLRQARRIVAVLGVHRLGHVDVRDLARRIGSCTTAGDLVAGDVEANGANVAAELDDERKANVADADDGDDDITYAHDLKYIFINNKLKWRGNLCIII